MIENVISFMVNGHSITALLMEQCWHPQVLLMWSFLHWRFTDFCQSEDRSAGILKSHQPHKVISKKLVQQTGLWIAHLLLAISPLSFTSMHKLWLLEYSTTLLPSNVRLILKWICHNKQFACPRWSFLSNESDVCIY